MRLLDDCEQAPTASVNAHDSENDKSNEITAAKQGNR